MESLDECRRLFQERKKFPEKFQLSIFLRLVSSHCRLDSSLNHIVGSLSFVVASERYLERERPENDQFLPPCFQVVSPPLYPFLFYLSSVLPVFAYSFTVFAVVYFVSRLLLDKRPVFVRWPWCCPILAIARCFEVRIAS